MGKRIRPSLFDNLSRSKDRNIYCYSKDLANEASVETFFVNRMLADLGFKDSQIKTKQSLKEYKISLGAKSQRYKPDYGIILKSKPRLIIDAKSTDVRIDDFVEQCSHYCMILNREKTKPVKYFMLSSGFETKLYEWDGSRLILELNFADFQYGNEKYEKLRSIIAYPALSTDEIEEEHENTFTLKKIDKEDAQKLFLSCHKYIWKEEKRNAFSAFMEFVKVVFLKLYHDRSTHEQYHQQEHVPELRVPKSSVAFSVHWIESREKDTPNPISDLQYKKLLKDIEDNIIKNNKKRIFDANDVINLKPQTIKAIVKKLEKYDLYGIDEDLNGRLFETFLSATMRGKELGQYFTPRSIVLLATKLAKLKANETHIDKVIDACCGTGGFLIEALTLMRNSVRNNQSYTDADKKKLILKLCNECLYGIDAAKAPDLARIARINMYLHVDGGSHIYNCDGLDKEIRIEPTDSQELKTETEDLKENLKKIGGFDVALTNPPFSMWYEIENEEGKRILEQYILAHKNNETSQLRNKVRSMELFIERYYDILKPNGKLITIIDDTILSARKFSITRDFIRSHFKIKAIISLHGDAFRMSGARVKTSLIYLEKKENCSEQQSSVFMYPSICLGVDDLPVTSNKSKIEEARKKANAEIEIICREYDEFSQGENGEWVVPTEKITDRLDVKSCLAKSGRFISKWKRAGYEIKKLSDIAIPVEIVIKPKDAEHANNEYRILTISYEGRTRAEETRKGRDIGYSKMKVVHAGDLVFSEYNSIQGAIGFITPEFEGALASGSYTVVRCEDDIDTLYLWSIMRTTELRNEMLSSAIGVGRQTIDWSDINKIHIPFPDKKERKKIYEDIIEAWKKEKEIADTFSQLQIKLNEKFNVESDSSKTWFEANKPPR
jgi:type I restriction enzyme M protein